MVEIFRTYPPGQKVLKKNENWAPGRGVYFPDLSPFYMQGGEKVAKSVSVTQLKTQLLESVDTGDLVQLEKVERYIELVKTFRAMSKAIKKDGELASIKIIGERNKISASLLSIEKAIKFKDGDSKSNLSDLI
jgi:hypothetical protein